MQASLTGQSRQFKGQPLPLIDIRQLEAQSQPGLTLLEVVGGEGWHRFRYGFLIARSSQPGETFKDLIKAYRQQYPGSRLYLSGAVNG